MGTMGDNKNANLLRNPYLQGLRISVGNRNHPGKCFPGLNKSLNFENMTVSPTPRVGSALVHFFMYCRS